MLGRSLQDFRNEYPNQQIEIAGLVFNGREREYPTPEQDRAIRSTRQFASQSGWHVLESQVYHSASFPSGSREGTPIFATSYARREIKQEFKSVAEELLVALGIR